MPRPPRAAEAGEHYDEHALDRENLCAEILRNGAEFDYSQQLHPNSDRQFQLQQRRQQERIATK